MADSNAENYLAVMRLLTPRGMAGKARLTDHFLRRKLAECKALKEIESLMMAGADTL